MRAFRISCAAGNVTGRVALLLWCAAHLVNLVADLLHPRLFDLLHVLASLGAACAVSGCLKVVIFAHEGVRLGYVAVRPGCEGEDLLVDMMAQISRFTGHNCPPSIIQRAVSRCLNVTSDLSVYETNMNLLYDKLKALGFEVERPGGTFYIFPKALEEDANAFCLRARAYDLLLVPSNSFGVKGYVRLAYCIDTEKVERSLPALEKLAASYRK